MRLRDPRVLLTESQWSFVNYEESIYPNMSAPLIERMAQWLVNGWCRETIFNLKLPMKKRYEEVSHNLAYIQAQLDEHGINAQIQARQLYHDREEVTVHVRRIWAAVGGRRDER